MTEAPVTILKTKPAFQRALSREDAAAYAGVDPKRFDTLVKDGRMPLPTKILGIELWDRRKLDAAMDAIFTQTVRRQQKVSV